MTKKKQKTRKSITKRFKITKRGKVLRRQSFRGHLNVKKTKKRKRRLKKTIEVGSAFAKKIRVRMGTRKAKSVKN